jgi:eukaryotic-like serine/threonine-protein kinase
VSDGLPGCARCGARLPAGRLAACPRCLLEAPLEPPTIGGGILEIEEEIGRGGMGSVFRARDVRLGRKVAVKLLPPELATPDLRARFEREARALALLNHPHIVTFHDMGEEDGQLYLVLELVLGGSLDRAMPLPLVRAVEVAAQVCDALAYAHGHGVVHRDVKPQNILLDEAGRAKVADFGIARLMRPEARGWTVTKADQAVGTPVYMAPEALSGAPPDPRMDIYSLGVVLYEMATGHLPAGAFDPPPKPIARVVLRALAPDPARRYPTAKEMHRDLLEALRDIRSLSNTGTASLSAWSPPGDAPTPAKDLKASIQELPPDERSWVTAVALLQSFSTGVALWAFVECVRPKVRSSDDLPPLIELATDRLPDGRLVSWARFETSWALATLATFAVAISAYAALRRHWRREQLEVALPDRAVPSSWKVLAWGVVAVSVYGLRKVLEAEGFKWVPRYVPIVGGGIEIAALLFFWITVLEAWRTSRPLRREPFLWLGFLLALIPPVHELFLYVKNWQG